MPDIFVDVDTDVILPVNILPLLDDTDFKSIETAVVYNSAGLAVTWNFVTAAGVVTGNAITPTTGGVFDWSEPIADKGMYAIEMPASGAAAGSNNDREGVGWFTGVATGVLPWRGPTIGFRRAALNDLFMDGGTASTNLEDFFDGTGYAGGTAKLTVNTVQVNGTSQTAGDIPALVTTVDTVVDAILVDTGTTLETDLDAIIAAVITNAAGVDIAADIIAVKADTAAILTDTGTTLEADLDAIIAAVITNAAGVDIAADIIAVKADTAAILTDTGTTLDAALAVVDANVDAILVDTAVIGAAGAGLTDLGGMSTTMKAQVETEANDALVANNLDHIALTAVAIPAIPAGTYIDQMMDDGTAVYDRTTDSLQAIRDRGDAAWDTADVSALALQTSVDDLEGRLSATRAGYLDNLSAGAVALEATAQSILTDTAVIGAAGAGLTAVPWNATWDAEVQSEVDDALDTTVADSVPADGTRPTFEQALYMIWQFLAERSVSGTTVTVKKADGSTGLMTFTLDDATTPTSITRAT